MLMRFCSTQSSCAAFVQIRDPIARGISVAASSHVLGTSSLVRMRSTLVSDADAPPEFAWPGLVTVPFNDKGRFSQFVQTDFFDKQ